MSKGDCLMWTSCTPTFQKIIKWTMDWNVYYLARMRARIITRLLEKTADEEHHFHAC